MSNIRFKTYQASPSELQLQSSNYQARVQALPQGIWRVLIYHRPEDSQKSSWNISRLPEAQPFELSDLGNQLQLRQGEQSISLDLSPFRLNWKGLICDGLHSEPVKSMFQAIPQIPREETQAFLEHPVRDKLDGLPQGSGLTLDWRMQAADCFYGLGERTGFLNKRGRRWHNWTTDQFFHLPQADPLYQSHPFMLLQRQGQYMGIYLDESWYSSFDLGFTDPEQWSLHTAGPTCDLYLIPGPDPQSILSRYSELLGKAPMPPLWALGKHQCRWSYPDQNVVYEVARQYRAHQMPLDALWLDIDYMESYKVFSFSPHRFPSPGQLTQELASMGIRTVVIVDPGVKIDAGYEIYEQGSSIKAWIRSFKDENLVGTVWPDPVVWPDFTQPAVQSWWGRCHAFYLEQGIAGIWNDMNEPAAFDWAGKTLPLDARQGAYSHAEVHNLYGYQMAQATYQGLKELQPEKRPFVLTRSGCPGIQKYAWVWTGDNASYWEHLEGSIPMLLNLGLSGVPFAGADIGGFSGDADGELLAAWTWLGVCYPFMRNHAGKRSRRQEPWQFGEPWVSLIREAVNFRYRLLPYLYTLSYQATLDGLPLMRPLLLDYPDDPETYQLNDQFLLGQDLLVAPVMRPAQTRRLVYLPAGKWYDFWSQQAYDGNQWIQVTLSQTRMALFQRAGSAIPMAPAQLHTTDAHWPELIWRIAPSESISGRLYSDSGEGPVDGKLLQFSGQHQPGRLSVAFERGNRQVRLAISGLSNLPGATQDDESCWQIELHSDHQEISL